MHITVWHQRPHLQMNQLVNSQTYTDPKDIKRLRMLSHDVLDSRIPMEHLGVHLTSILA